jgi:NAD(P)H-hydrate epimerase
MTSTAGYTDIKNCLKKHLAGSHKGENGCVLVIGGSEDYVSAPALAASASLRTGIDLIVVAAPEKAAYAINGLYIDFITKKMPGDFFTAEHTDFLLDYSQDFDAVVVGPGLGKRPETRRFVNEFVKKCAVRLVVDADAIQLLDRKYARGLITPHEREFEMCFGERPSPKLEERVRAVKAHAKKSNCSILLKGAIDVISDGTKVKVNKTGNVGMTVGGTGDILSGLCAGFIAQGGSYLQAASAAAYTNGVIGDSLYKKMGYGFVASDFIPLIPQVVYKRKG